MKILPATYGMVCLFSSIILSCNTPSSRSPDRSPDQIGPQVLRFSPTVAAKSIIPERVAVTHRAFYHKTRQQLAANLRDSSFLKRNFDLPEGEAFTRDALLMLLSNPRARFVRAYLGNKNGQVKLILVPVDARGNDILNPLLNESGRPINYDSLQLRNTRFFDFSGQTVESDMRCPLGCSSYRLL